MNYSLPEETLILQESVRRFVENELIPLEQELPDRSNSFQLPEKLHAELTAKVREMVLQPGMSQKMSVEQDSAHWTIV